VLTQLVDMFTVDAVAASKVHLIITISKTKSRFYAKSLCKFIVTVSMTTPNGKDVFKTFSDVVLEQL